MRKLFSVSCIFLTAIASSCGDKVTKISPGSSLKQDNTVTSEIVFREYEHSFGTVTEGEKLSYSFVFTNKGAEELVLNSVTTTCGCTIPKYDNKPVHPGNNGEIEVVFNTSGRVGMQTKVITVRSNALTPVVLLKISADVISANK